MFINILSVIIITVLLLLLIIIIKTVLIIGGIHFGDYSGSREKGGERTMDNAFAYFAPSAPTTPHCTAQCPLTTTQISSLPHNYFTVILCSCHSVQLRAKHQFLSSNICTIYFTVYFTVLVLSMQV